MSKSAFDRSQKRSVSLLSITIQYRLAASIPAIILPLFLQPISWTSLAVLVVGGGVAVAYVKYLKAEKAKGVFD